MTIYFGYEKGQVIQALRYHFISRQEIRIMLILVNVFALASVTLYALGKITPMAFFMGSAPVSYTHLDVYKRQEQDLWDLPCYR